MRDEGKVSRVLACLDETTSCKDVRTLVGPLLVQSNPDFLGKQLGGSARASTGTVLVPGW